MKSIRTWAALAGAAVAVGGATAVTVLPASAASGRDTLAGSLAASAERSHRQGAVASSSGVSFDVVLSLSDSAGAAAAARAASDPASSSYRHYLSDAQWVARFAPTAAAVSSVESWLRAQGFAVGAVPSDRLFVPAQGSAAQVARAFGTSLGTYRVNGHSLRLADSALSIPSSLAGVISGVSGVNQQMASPAQEPPPPAGFRNPEPCSAYWGQKTDTTDSPSLYKPYTSPLPYDICGYKPDQLRDAYSIDSSKADGSGVTLAIVDAYDSPTLLSDAQHYFSLNDPSHPLSSSQFINVEPSTTDDYSACLASGWFSEQALDVESSHSMAPGANILFVGAQDCLDSSLLSALTTAITSGASVVSDSWGDTLGDIFTDAATRTAFDNTFLLADGTGVSVLFSSGDFGDNFAISGLTAPDYPASSPYITAVGGTSLEVNQNDQRQAEYGWSTGKQVLCGPVTVKNCGSATTPEGTLALQAAGGGGTSYQYSEPYYQASVVPVALAERNAKVTGILNRVEPDISLDADAQTGMLIGLTQTYPKSGTHYGQFKEGGTSLASPLLAGVIADTDEVAGVSLGFLNPSLYKAYSEHPGAFDDVVPQAHPHQTATIRVDYANTVNQSAGYLVSLRVLTYEGVEVYCDLTGNCASRDVTLTTAPGFDSMTGLGSIGPSFIDRLAKL